MTDDPARRIVNACRTIHGAWPDMLTVTNAPHEMHTRASGCVTCPKETP